MILKKNTIYQITLITYKENNVSRNLIKKTLILNNHHKIIINEWFSNLQDQECYFFGKAYNGLKLRADLKKVPFPYGVMLKEGYWLLANQLFEENSFLIGSDNHHQALAIFVAVAIFAKLNNENASFASQLNETKEKNQQKFLSPLRFNQLVANITDEEFCRRLIRAVKSRGDEGVNLFSLADSIFLWAKERDNRQKNLLNNMEPFKRNSVRWAMDYYSTEKSIKE